MRLAPLLIVGLLVTSTIACGGSTPVGPVPPVPVISAVSPSPNAGEPGATVTFRATSSNNPTSWRWSFGSGATPATSTDAQPVVELGLAATYDATVVAINAHGESTPFAFTYRVALGLPSVAVVIPSGAPEPEGKLVTFSAIAGPTPILSYAWDFGDAATLSTSTEPNPSVRLSSPGSYTGRLTITNSTGSSSPFEFPIEVGDGTEQFFSDVIPFERVGDAGDSREFRAIGINGPALPPHTYRWRFSEGTEPRESTDPRPTVVLGPPGSYTGVVQILTTGGYSMPFNFSFVVDDHSPPPSVMQLPKSNIDTLAWLWFPTLEVIGGVPVVVSVSQDDGAKRGLIYARARNASPVGQADWIIYRLASDGNYFVRPGIVELANGMVLAVAVGPEVTFLVSDVTTPNSVEDWTIYDIPGVVPYVDTVHLSLVDGKPVMVAGKPASVALASNPVPLSAADWQFHQATDDTKLPVSPVVKHDGVWAFGIGTPLACEGCRDDLRWMRSVMPVPTDPSDWVTQTISPGIWRHNDFRLINNRLLSIGTQDARSTLSFISGMVSPSSAADWQSQDTHIPPQRFLLPVDLSDRLALVFSANHGYLGSPFDPLPYPEIEIAWLTSPSDPVLGEWHSAALSIDSDGEVASDGDTVYVLTR